MFERKNYAKTRESSYSEYGVYCTLAGGTCCSYAGGLSYLLSSAVAVANFFAMAMAVQKAVGLKEKDAAAKLKLSHSFRFMALIAFAVVGCLLFDPLASVIPLVFPRFAIMLYPIFSKKKEESQQ